MPQQKRTTGQTSFPEQPPFQDVLIPTDGSGVLYEAFDSVAPVLACCDATVHALHVIPTGAKTRDRIRYDPQTEAERTKNEVADYLTERGFDVQSKLTNGMPEDEIVSEADAVDADLIVMVTRGGGLLNPSITRMVIQAVDVPVMALSP